MLVLITTVIAIFYISTRTDRHCLVFTFDIMTYQQQDQTNKQMVKYCLKPMTFFKKNDTMLFLDSRRTPHYVIGQSMMNNFEIKKILGGEAKIIVGILHIIKCILIY
jgi:hypothetical protein